LKRFRSLFAIAAAALALTGSASAATLSYTFAGGAATGSLNGVAFTATSFSITATGDSSAIQSGLVGPGLLALSTAVSAPFVQINTNSGPITTTLISETPGYLWRAVSLDYYAAATAYGFVLGEALDNWDTNIVLYLPPVSLDLSTPATYSGPILNVSPSLPTSGGALVLDPSDTTASFIVSSVPEPATATSSLLLSLGGLSLISRRNRKA
jgi:hypothetical protein